MDINNYEPGLKYGAQIQTDPSNSSPDIALAVNQVIVGNASGNGVASSRIASGLGYGSVAVPTGASSALVPLFANPNGIAGTVTSVTVISGDSTAGTILVINNGVGVGTIVKLNAIGGVKGTALSIGVAFTATGSINVQSVGSDIATVIASFTLV